MAVLSQFLNTRALLVLCGLLIIINASHVAYADATVGLVTSYDMNAITVIDPNSNSILTSFTTDTQPRAVVIDPGGKTVYVSNYVSKTITVHDVSGYTRTGTIAVPTSCYGLAINQNGTVLYATDLQNHVYVIDAARRTLLGTITLNYNIGYCSPCVVKNKLYVCCNANNVVAAIDTNTNTVKSYIPVGITPGGIAGSSITDRAYVSNIGNGTVSVINTITDQVVATITVGSGPWFPCVSNDGIRVYVPNAYSDNVSVIDTTNNQVVATITVGDEPRATSIDPSNQRVYVTNFKSNTVSVINTATYTVMSTISCPYNTPGYITMGKIAGETSTTAPMMVTFIINTDAIKFHKNVNVSVYDAYTGVFIGSDPTDDNGGSIFWLIPGKRYLVRLDSQDPLMAMQLEVQVQPSDNEYWINVIDTNQGIIASRSIVDSLYKQHYVKIVVNGNIGPISLKRQPWMNVDVYRGNILLYTGNTGTTGEISYRLSYDVYYRIHVYNQTMDIDKTVYTYANDPTVYINTRMSQNPGGILANNNSTITTGTGTGNVLRDVQTRVYTTKDGTNGQIICEYNDASHQTINVTFQLYGRNITGPNDILIQTQTINNNNCTHTFTIQQCNGREFRVVITGHNSRYGDVIRTYTPRFADEKLLPGVPRDLHPIIALLLIGAIGLIFTHITMGVGGCCMVAAGMILQGWGWFTGVPDGVMQVILWLGGFASLILIFIESRGD